MNEYIHTYIYTRSLHRFISTSTISTHTTPSHTKHFLKQPCPKIIIRSMTHANATDQLPQTFIGKAINFIFLGLGLWLSCLHLSHPFVESREIFLCICLMWSSLRIWYFWCLINQHKCCMLSLFNVSISHTLESTSVNTISDNEWLLLLLMFLKP